MNITSTDLARGREIAGGLLEALGVEAYLYELQPREGSWEVRVECAAADGWKHCTWSLSLDDLLASNRDAALRKQLLKVWAEHLRGCKRSRLASAARK